MPDGSDWHEGMNSPLLTQICLFYLGISIAKLSSYANGKDNLIFTEHGVKLLNKAINYSLFVLLFVEVGITVSPK